MTMDLEQLRKELDGVDTELTDLFLKRMDLCRQVAEYKKEHGLAVVNQGREREILSRISAQAGDQLDGYARILFATLFDLSRTYQGQLMAPESAVARDIQHALETTPQLFPKKAVVACQGVEGSYAQQACDKAFAFADIMYFRTWEGVFSAVQKGMCQYGVLPIENSTAGSVNAIYDLMTRHNFSIVRSARLKVSHNLLGKYGVKKEDIKEVYSHQQAISQCADYLAGLKDVKVTVVENTAMAARMVAQSERTDVAALSSRFCAEEYGLNLLDTNVQDQDNNYTRFICISKNPEIYPGADRTSLMMTLPHKPGSLYNVLSKFYALGINLRKLESRPLPNREFEFMFYFDLECSVYAPEMERIFRDLEEESEHFRYLGTYNEVIC